MASGRSGIALGQIRRLFDEGTLTGLTDAQILDRFVARRDEGAFAILVERHGPMVLAVCRGVLKDVNDAEDAFQATFLVLFRKAGGLRVGRIAGELALPGGLPDRDPGQRRGRPSPRTVVGGERDGRRSRVDG